MQTSMNCGSMNFGSTNLGGANIWSTNVENIGNKLRGRNRTESIKEQNNGKSKRLISKLHLDSPLDIDCDWSTC